jgi:Tol biopolymer transport system component
MRIRILVVSTVVAALLTPVVPGPADATYSGDNGRIAFRRFFNADKTWGAIFTINPDGTDERQVTHPPKGTVDRNPDISPDGTRILFQRENFECLDLCPTQQVWVVDADGSNAHRLAAGPQPARSCDDGGYCDASPAWSPDGKRIAFSRGSGPANEDFLLKRMGIYVMRADGTHVRRITQKSLPAQGEDQEPQWSPDGTRILFQRWNVRDARPKGSLALWVVTLATGREHRITPFRLRAGDTPDWSPDGTTILFHDNLEKDTRSANLWTVHPDGSHLHQLTFLDDGGVTNYLGSSFSPDGTRIVFGRRPATGGRSLNSADVFTMALDGTDEQPVTRTRAYDSYPDWGPAPAG